MNSKEKTGLIFNIQRHSTEDGPGIRTTVFLKGCSMRCPWCHNPEAIKATPELVWYASKCIGARHCLEACPQGALNLTEEGVIIDRSLCDGCEKCVPVCPAGALELLGKRQTVDEVAKKVLREKVFYEKSGGGITISGGEPALQAPFVMALMKAIREADVHIALDTCAGVKWKMLGPVVELADLVLLDLKIMDEDAHLKVLGVPLDLVLENAKKIAQLKKSIWVRTPVIPGYTDNEDNIRKIAGFIKEYLPTVERYDILAFNNLCSSKYERLGRPWELETAEKITKEKMETLAKAAKEEGLDFVQWSGLTKLEEN
ncbi:MAG: glycyl-radical enzyme activating protein [Deltaproteobacteria bacterium]|nr:glycyl-radical enzyme activating protein [Deltaproteobacteria bacterium]